MCGGAILSDIIPPPRRVTDGPLWRNQKKKGPTGDAPVARRRRVPEEEESYEDFEADFEGFEEGLGEAEIWSEDEAKPLSAARKRVAAGIAALFGSPALDLWNLILFRIWEIDLSFLDDLLLGLASCTFDLFAIKLNLCKCSS
jgi:hypothetical protein